MSENPNQNSIANTPTRFFFRQNEARHATTRLISVSGSSKTCDADTSSSTTFVGWTIVTAG